MILALDVGNTNITCGVFDGDRIKASFRITTKMPRTSDEYGMLLSTLLERNQVGMDDILLLHSLAVLLAIHEVYAL